MQASDSTRPAKSEPNASAGRVVVRNTLFLSAAQVVMIPLSIATNAIMARYLGPVEFGHIYLATTLCGFAFLLIEWGGQGVLPAEIAREHARAATFLGTSIGFRTLISGVVYLALAFGCHLFGYGRELQWALGLSFVSTLLSSFGNALKDTVRGFERTDIPAIAQVGQQLLVALVTAPVLIIGGRMRATLAAQMVAIAITMWLLWRSLRLVGITRLSFERSTLRSLLREGTPFVFFGAAVALQPNIDAVYLSKLTPEAVMGWFAVSRRLLGVLLFPASALLSALYPTLCRLFTTDLPGFVKTARGSLYSVALVVVPIALGCGLYPEIGISIFSRDSFGPAEDNLRVSAAFVFLVYFSMPLGICILAANKQRAWSIVQSLCVAISLALDPVLVPIFQRRTGNGGLGPCVAGVISEIVVVVCGVVLAPAGIFDRRFARSVGLAVVAGGAMAGCAHLLRSITPFVAAPISVLVYAVGLVVTGAIEKEQIAKVRGMVQRRLSRAR